MCALIATCSKGGVHSHLLNPPMVLLYYKCLFHSVFLVHYIYLYGSELYRIEYPGSVKRTWRLAYKYTVLAISLGGFRSLSKRCVTSFSTSVAEATKVAFKKDKCSACLDNSHANANFQNHKNIIIMFY